jgi:MerR family transcriptional regulator, thiopeptide resistance regulator
MSWSITEVARMSGVTSRTLRHYDDIGLLPPAYVGANGYRYYERAQLLRLQRILLMREVGMDLASIAEVLEGEVGPLEALRRHHRALVAERDRYGRLADLVAKTITRLEEGPGMEPEELFDGLTLSPETIAGLEEVSVRRAGEEVRPYFDELKRNTEDWPQERFDELGRQAAAFERRLLELMRAGTPVDDPVVLDLMAEDYTAQSQMVSLDKEEYVRLGRAFVASPELRAHLDAQDPALAEYLCDAMGAYARERLSP